MFDINEISHLDIREAAKEAGAENVEFIGQYPHPTHDGGDWMITLYSVSGVKVIGTNGNSIWEEDSPEDFAEILKEYEIEL